MPSKRLDLNNRARDFAGALSTVLNGSITSGVRLSAVTAPRLNKRVFVGYNLTRRDPTHREVFPVGKEKQVHLGLWYELQLDDRGFLAVQTSVISIYLGSDRRQELLHFDYERDKPHGYPEAHLQVIAGSDAWSDLLSGRLAANDSLSKLHLPVGGRRFRPALEHVVEFLIRESLVTPTNNSWEANLEASRKEFEIKQLRAAVWRNPDVARAALDDFDTAQRA